MYLQRRYTEGALALKNFLIIALFPIIRYIRICFCCRL